MVRPCSLSTSPGEETGGEDGRHPEPIVLGYGLGRFWIEGLRIDEADIVAGLRWNQWMAIAAIAGGSVDAGMQGERYDAL